MKTTAKDLAAWLADQPGEMVITMGETGKPRAADEYQVFDAVKRSIDYIANRSRVRLEAATQGWRDSIRGPTEARIYSWKQLVKLREEFEAEHGDA